MIKGLSTQEVKKSREKNGTNEIVKNKSDSFLKLLISTLGDPIIKILLIALAIKTLFLFKDFDWYETIGIVVAIFFASFILNKVFKIFKKFLQCQGRGAILEPQKRREHIPDLLV